MSDDNSKSILTVLALANDRSSGRTFLIVDGKVDGSEIDPQNPLQLRGS